MTNDHAIWLIMFVIYVFGGVLTGIATRQNGAPIGAAIFLGITYPIVLPICIAYEFIKTIY